MQMAELSGASGVPVATVKFYLRDGLLPPGEPTSATRAAYDESHVRRLRLIRALADVAGLRLDQIRHVLAVVDDESTSCAEALGTALMPRTADAGPDPEARRRVDRLIRRWRWRVGPDSRNRDSLARALSVLDSLEHPMPDEMLDRYAEAMHQVADAEVSSVPTDNRDRAVLHAVVGTLLVEPVLASIRRLAQEEISRRRLTGRLRKGRRPRRPARG
ncbi:MAG: MerR family transcriptional regulator [Propionibacteriales bacterium]|nr:MerR family transcriptional regulator [Propionibacteriales bacterium]